MIETVAQEGVVEWCNPLTLKSEQSRGVGLSIHVESLENLINVFWAIFSVFEIETFKKLAYSSVNED